MGLFKPWIGVLTWTWVSIMNPHKLTFGFLRDFPVAAITAGVTVLGVLLTQDRRKLPLSSVTYSLLAFILWMCVTSLFAIHPDMIGTMFSKVMKIQFMLFVTLLVLHTRKHIELFIWVLVISLGFYGVKGGIFTLMHGGHGRVAGPPGGFIEGNNELALALTMTIPLMFYLRQMARQKWVRWSFDGSIVLTALSILGSHSRGALLAIAAMAGYLWWQSRRKFGFGLMLLIVGVAMLAFMPASWDERMATIATYQHDSSAEGRINAWWMSFNLAKHNFFGGGFEVITPDLFARYAPNPTNLHAAHSIYFQILGEHGFVGLGLFLLFWCLTWRSASALVREAKQVVDMRWAQTLGPLVQASLVGYFVGGAFLSLAYFDLPYDLMVVVVLTRVLVSERLRSAPVELQVRPGRLAAPGLHRRESSDATSLERPQ